MIINQGKGKPEQNKNMTLGSSAPSTVTPDNGYTLGSVAPSINTSVVKSANIKKGVSILGVSGSSTVVDTSDANATSNKIASGYSGYVNGSKVSGSLTEQASKIVTPGISSQTAVASGKYTTGNVYVAGDSDLVASNIKEGVSIFGVTGTAKTVVTGTATADNAQQMTIPEARGKDQIIIYRTDNGYITTGVAAVYIADEDHLKEHYGLGQDGYYKIGSAYSWSDQYGRAVLKNACFDMDVTYSFVAW